MNQRQQVQNVIDAVNPLLDLIGEVTRDSEIEGRCQEIRSQIDAALNCALEAHTAPALKAVKPAGHSAAAGLC